MTGTFLIGKNNMICILGKRKMVTEQMVTKCLRKKVTWKKNHIKKKVSLPCITTYTAVLMVRIHSYFVGISIRK